MKRAYDPDEYEVMPGSLGLGSLSIYEPLRSRTRKVPQRRRFPFGFQAPPPKKPRKRG